MLSVKKSMLWVGNTYLQELIELPMQFIRKLVYTVAKWYYGRPEALPVDIISFCFPMYLVQDRVGKNGMLIPYIVSQLAAIHHVNASDFRLYRSWNRLVVECKLITDEDFEELFNVLSSTPDELFNNVLDHAIKHGDIDAQVHGNRVMFEKRYREGLAEIQDTIRLGLS